MFGSYKVLRKEKKLLWKMTSYIQIQDTMKNDKE